jgi:Carboxypeptidase regulatory-like domain
MTALRAPVCAVLALLASMPGTAQFAQRSSITGTVTDQSGAVVPNAAVTLTNLDQEKATATQTNGNGQYTFTQLNIGHYQVSIDQPGFQKAVSNSIELTTQQNARFDFTLVPGSTSQRVEVTSAEPLVEADRASVDQNINFQQIQSLPINGRNYTSLAALLLRLRQRRCPMLILAAHTTSALIM